jgi:uncharacterized protein (TIGR04141 family)
MSGHDAFDGPPANHVAAVSGKLDAFAERFKSKDYKKTFGWIDHIGEVTDQAVIQELDEKLLDALRAGNLGAVYMAVPEPIEWAQVSCFRYTPAGADHDELRTEDLLASLHDPTTVTRTTLATRQVRCIGKDADEVMHHWSAWKCLNFETDLGTERYVLASGIWYKIASSFAKSINKQVAAIPLVRCPQTLTTMRTSRLTTTVWRARREA